MKKILNVIIILIIFCGCAHVNGDVKFLKDPNAKLASLRKFNFKNKKYDNDADYLRNINLETILKEKMLTKGFVFDQNQPDFLVDLSFKCEPKEMRDNAFLWFKHDVLYNTQYIKISFFPVNSEKPVWTGEALAADEDLGTDIKQCAPYLINEILLEYPNGSGKDEIRKIYTPGRKD